DRSRAIGSPVRHRRAKRAAGPRADRQLTGADLAQSCGVSDPSLAQFCAGYVQGVIDMGMNGADVFDPAAICLPPGTPRADVVAAVADILAALPDIAEDPA